MKQREKANTSRFIFIGLLVVLCFVINLIGGT